MQVGPLLLILLLSLMMNFTSTSSDASYNFSYQQSHFHPVQVISYRIKQTYFISERSAWELRADINKKYKVTIK